MATSGDALLAEAGAAFDAGDLATARRLAEEVLAAGPDAAAHRLLGGLHYLDDDHDGARRHWELAFRTARGADDRRGAARSAIDLAGLLATDSPNAVSAGWLERARRLLDGLDPCVEQGYLELAVMACDRPDAEDLAASAERALDIAGRFGDVDLEAQALADSGLALVTAGRTQEGFARLDAALAAISAGEVQPVAAGICFCSMLTACDRADDLRRAQEWSELIRAVVDAADGRPRALRTHCRVAYGAVLTTVGRWNEAEAVMIDALGPPERPAVTHRDLTAAHLAQLRLDQGRREEAAQLLAPFEDRLCACLPLARLHLEDGDADLAAACLRRGLALLVGDALREVPLRALLVQAELARGDHAAAAVAAAELAELAAEVDLAHPTAEAEVAVARVAAANGDHAEALTRYTHAATVLADGTRPMLAGTVRLETAHVLLAAGDPAAAVAEARAAAACLDRLGASAARDRTAAFLRALGAEPARSASRTDGVDELTGREREVLALVGAGLTNAEIGERLYISAKTVEHHVGRVLAKLGVRRRAEAAALAVRTGVAPGEPGAR